MDQTRWVSLVVTDSGSSVTGHLLAETHCDCHGKNTFKKEIKLPGILCPSFWDWAASAVVLAAEDICPCEAQVKVDGKWTPFEVECEHDEP